MNKYVIRQIDNVYQVDFLAARRDREETKLEKHLKQIQETRKMRIASRLEEFLGSLT